MPDLRRAHCQVCHKPATDVGPISWRGRCRPCGLKREADAITQMAEHDGPVFELWRERMAACVGGTLPEPPTVRS